MAVRISIAITLLVLLVAPVSAQLEQEEKAQLELALDRSSYAPGDEVRLAAIMSIDDGWHVNGNQPSYDYLIPTTLEVTAPGDAEVTIVYPDHEMKPFAFTDEPIAVYEGRVVMVASFTLPAALEGNTANLEASLLYQACDDKSCLRPVTVKQSLGLAIGETGASTNAALFDGDATAAAAVGSGSSGQSGGLAMMLLFGVLGGLILNAMPCVLPVLSLKLFGLVKDAGESRGTVVAGALATVAGVLVSFWALAALAVGARAAGAAVGWGVQFQQPGFVAFLAVIVVLFSLNMWGLFEIQLPQKVAQVGGTSRDGLAGHFASGLFATLMATPCSAPFLAPAVGFALAQPAWLIFAMFTAVGVGLALPYILLAIAPQMVKLLPKPGAWMVMLRGVMGFLLAASAVWLFFVLGGQIAAAWVAFVQLALLTVALFVWLHGQSRTGATARLVAVAGVVLASFATIALATSAPVKVVGEGDGGASAYFDWRPFDETAAIDLADDGRMVFVDITADWCLTCKANEAGVIETAKVAEAFERHDVITMKADWTNRDDIIAEYLARWGRSSIPFYILYRPGQDPHVFPSVLTKGELVGTVEDSARAVSASLD
ncbi:MAG: thioredoxin family protein [Acidobacteriota bacterium]